MKYFLRCILNLIPAISHKYKTLRVKVRQWSRLVEPEMIWQHKIGIYLKPFISSEMFISNLNRFPMPNLLLASILQKIVWLRKGFNLMLMHQPIISRLLTIQWKADNQAYYMQHISETMTHNTQHYSKNSWTKKISRAINEIGSIAWTLIKHWNSRTFSTLWRHLVLHNLYSKSKLTSKVKKDDVDSNVRVAITAIPFASWPCTISSNLCRKDIFRFIFWFQKIIIYV